MLITVNGVELYYEKAGNGAQALIMLHGNGETSGIFDRAIPLLAARFTVYAIDTRGHGKSAAVNEYHYMDMMEDVHGFIEALALSKPYVYGFSDGGIVGLLLASRYPGLVGKLCVSGANLYPEGIRSGWLRFFTILQKRVKDPKLQMMLDEPHITDEMLARISCPTAVLAGGHDMVKRAHTKEIAAKIGGSELHILPLDGHGSYIVHSKRIARLLLKLWSERDERRTRNGNGGMHNGKDAAGA